LPKNIANSIFKTVTDKQKVLCPLDQVFLKSDFDFLLTTGGDLFQDENEFEKLKSLLKSIGETEFNIVENIGATVTERAIPFQTTISLDSDYKDFEEIVSSLDPPFGWLINHFFVFGCIDNWGIYICEYPTINIIGCDKRLTESFKLVFSIVENGYETHKDFLDLEFQSKPELKTQFINQYKLKYQNQSSSNAQQQL